MQAKGPLDGQGRRHSMSVESLYAILQDSLTTFANPTALIGLAAVNGVATSAMRSDAAPALSQAITPTWSARHIFDSNVNFRGVWSTDDIVGNVENWNPDGSGGAGSFAGSCTVRVSSLGGTWNIGGMSAGTDGEIKILYNAGALNLVFLHESLGSSPENRFLFIGLRSQVFSPNSFFFFQYDGLAGRWRTQSALPVFANPTALIGLAAVNGVATSAMRSDAAPALSQAITPTWSARHIFNSNVNFRGVWTTNPVTGSIDNWNPDGSGGAGSFAAACTVRIEGTGGTWNIGGMLAGTDGEIKILYNRGAYNLVFLHESLGSTAANRFNFMGATLELQHQLCTPHSFFIFQYDGTVARWRGMGGPNMGAWTATSSGIKATGGGTSFATVQLTSNDNPGGSAIRGYQHLAPNRGTGHVVAGMWFGVALATRNVGMLDFFYAGPNSTNNAIALATWGFNWSHWFYPDTGGYVLGAPVSGNPGNPGQGILHAQGGLITGKNAAPNAITGTVKFHGITSGIITVTGVAVASGTNTLQAVTDTFVYLATVDTLTNKRITPRVVSMANATSFTPTSDTADINTHDNAQFAGVLTANAPSGTPTNGQELWLRIKSTTVQTYAWNGVYRGGGVALPAASSGGGKIDYIQFKYHSTDNKWDIIQYAAGY